MNKKIVVSVAALLLVGAGTIYTFGSGYVPFGEPTQEQLDAAISQAAETAAQQTAAELVQSSASQDKELEELRQQVEQLNDALAETEGTATTPPTSEMQVVQVSLPASAESKPVAPESKSTSVSSAPPANIQNVGTVFEGYTVTVTDKNTPAVRAAGTDWPITTYYFISGDGDRLGSITGTAMNGIIKKYEATLGANEEWEFWFAEQFNSYRGLSGEDSDIMESGKDTFDASIPKTDTNFNAVALASEAFALVNEERVKNGLYEVEMDSIMMERAELRAEELEERYDHVRPDGTRMSVTYKCAEIINRRADTAAIAVSSWMDSSGHKDIILKEKYSYAGIGSYQGADGTVYWCMLFSK